MADFAYHFDRVKGFYGHDWRATESFARAAKEIHYPDDRRALLVAALLAQNGPSETLDRLARPGTVAVVTGQQVGLFSGPAYTVYKALSAASLARQLTARGIEAVPVFWLATEDHDFAEVDHVWLFGGVNEPAMIRLAQAANGKPGPVGHITISEPPIGELRASLSGLPHSDEVVAMVEQAYRPGVTMGEGFHALLKNILNKAGLLYLDPLDPAIREIGAPFMRKALTSATELRGLLTQRNQELANSGYHAQVHVDAKTSLFFLLEKGARTPLRLRDEEYAALAERAEQVSPNALLRPVWQDFLLPSVAYIGGPGELAYLAQSQVIYQELLGHMPVSVPRNSFTILDGHSQKLLDRLGIPVQHAFVPEQAFRDRFAQAAAPPALRQAMVHTTDEVRAKLEGLRDQLKSFDPTLADSLEKSQAKILYQLKKVASKAAREYLRRDQRAAMDARRLTNLVYPHRHPQERFYSVLPLLAKHGTYLIDQLSSVVDVGCPDHRVLILH